MEKECQVCDLPYMTRKEVEGMLLGGWSPEDLEHWVALRFRLKISPTTLQHHYEECYFNPPPGRELLEVVKPEPSLVFHSLFPRQPQQSKAPSPIQQTSGHRYTEREQQNKD